MNYVDLTKETTAATDASVITLLGKVDGYRSFAEGLQVGATRIPVFTKDATGKFEASWYTLSATNTLTRTSIINSSAGLGVAETFAPGIKEVFCSLPGAVAAKMSLVDDVAFSTTIPLTSPGTSYMPPQTVAGALAFTAAAAPRQGALVYVRLTANGTNAPTFTGIKEWGGSSGYDNRAGIANQVQFFHDGVDSWYSISQAVGAVAVAPGAPTVTSVTVSPSTAAVAGGGTQAYTAVVNGTNSPAQTVTWSASAGSITSGGVFTAPAASGSAQTITITATSTADGTKAGTATATIASNSSTVSSVAVTPSAPSVVGTTTQQFTAVVTGTSSPSQAVTWSSNIGAITSGGLYTAPTATGSAQTATITATSSQDGTKSGTATVTIPVVAAPGAPTIGTAVAGDGYVDVAFTAPASNGGSAITGYTATLSTGETNTGTTSPIRVTAANGAARTGHVTATNAVGTGAASAESNSVTPAAPVVTVYPRMTAGYTNLTEGGTGPYTYTGLNNPDYSGAKGGIVDQALQSGVDGSLAYTRDQAGTMLNDAPIMGVTAGTAIVNFASLAVAVHHGSSGGGNYLVYELGTPKTAVNAVPSAAGDVVRMRRSGTSIISEVSKDSGATWTTIYTSVGQSTGVLRFLITVRGIGRISNLTPVGLA